MDNTTETTAIGNKADCETLTIEIKGGQSEKNLPVRDDTPDDHIDNMDFDNDVVLKTKEWSFFHEDRRPDDVYLLLATVADSSGVPTKRLLVGTWNEYTNNWQCQEGFKGSVIQVLAWLWIREIDVHAFYNLDEMWDGFREKQLAYAMFDRTDALEDQNNGQAI